MEIKHTPKEEITEYFNSDLLNQSLIKAAALGANSFRSAYEKRFTNSDKYYSEEPEFFTIGSAVDFAFTMEEPFESEYYRSNLISKPSPMVISIIRAVFDQVTSMELAEIPPLFCNTVEPLIKDSLEVHDWYNTWGIPARIKKVIEEGSEYWVELTEAKGRKILTVDQWDKIMLIAESLKKSSVWNKILEGATSVNFQLPCYSDDRKALFDIVVSYRNKPPLIVDLKTTSFNLDNFDSVIRKRRYDIQAAFYSDVFNLVHEKRANFAFLVESSVSPAYPVLYYASPDLLSLGRDGRTGKYIQAINDETFEPSLHYIPPISGYQKLENIAREYISRIDEGYPLSDYRKSDVKVAEWEASFPRESNFDINSYSTPTQTMR